MKRRLLDLVVCPVCHAPLALHAFHEISEPVAVTPSKPACLRRCEFLGISVEDGAPKPTGGDCAACYATDIVEGILNCSGCHEVYPIAAGVPRLVRDALADHNVFVERHSSAITAAIGRPPRNGASKRDPKTFDPRSNESFGLQWTNQTDADKTWFKDDASLRKEEFLHSLAVEQDALRGALILDGGCGNGRLTASLAAFDAEVVGMDLSAGIDRAEASRRSRAQEHAPFVHFVQANVMELPFAPARFDIIHSSGVLHHTPSTERAFESFLTAVRPGGRVYVQLYRRREAWVGVPNTILRRLTSRLPTRLLYRLCLFAVPVHTALVLLVARFRGETSPIGSATRGERALSLFDNYSPRYQYRYHDWEVRRMFEAAGLIEVRETTLENEARHMVAFTGCMPASNHQQEEGRDTLVTNE